MTCYLADHYAVGDKQQCGGSVLAYDGLDQIESRSLLAQRDHHIARTRGNKLATTAFELDAFWRLDTSGLPDGVTELGHQWQVG